MKINLFAIRKIYWLYQYIINKTNIIFLFRIFNLQFPANPQYGCGCDIVEGAEGVDRGAGLFGYADKGVAVLDGVGGAVGVFLCFNFGKRNSRGGVF